MILTDNETKVDLLNNEAIAATIVELLADLSNAGITDIDGLTTEQIQTVFELYATHAIEARLCNDIGLKTVRMDELADVYRRGLEEVGKLLHGVKTVPG